MKTYLLIIILVVLGCSFLIPAIYYPELPAEIPTHFNALGEADHFSRKSSIWLLPCINIVIIIIVLGLSQHMQKAENNVEMPKYFPYALCLAITVLFTYINYASIQVALNEWKGLGSWLLPIVLGSTSILVVYSIWKSRKSTIKKH